MQMKNRSLKTQISVAALCACAGLAIAQPANNACSSAVVIAAPASVNGTNVAATTDGPAAGACGGSANDVWYRYTHPAGGVAQSLTIDTCSASNYDTVIRVFTGACGGLTQTQCNDDACALASSVTQNVTPGTTYYISVSGFNGATGTFTLSTTLSAPPVSSVGPDVIVGDLIDLGSYGAVGGISAFSIGTTSCNIGDANILWVANNNQHPVIGQNYYRIENNRMEMIGMSWLKHGFTALTQNLCGTCSGQGGAVLGVGCSDPYTASLNGSQSNLGPRSHINATTGFYPYPFTSPGAGYMVPPSAAATIGRRLQVLTTDMGHANAVYIGETQYVTADDATFVDTQPGPFQNTRHNGINNVSYRRINPAGTSFTIGSTTYSTVRMQPAIKAWQALDPSVVVNSYDVLENTNTVCRYWVGAKVVDNGNGTWTYNYIIMNVNSDRSGAGFSVPLSNVTVTSPFSRLPVYHSGEAVTMNAAWVNTVGSTEVSWSTPQTFAQNANSSALRWSTSATFAFTANTPPTTGTATMNLFKPGTAGPIAMTNLPVPSAGAPDCAADFNNDGSVDFFDYLDFVDAFSANDPSADFNGDSSIDFFDYLDFVDAFSIGCP